MHIVQLNPFVSFVSSGLTTLRWLSKKYVVCGIVNRMCMNSKKSSYWLESDLFSLLWDLIWIFITLTSHWLQLSKSSKWLKMHWHKWRGILLTTGKPSTLFSSAVPCLILNLTENDMGIGFLVVWGTSSFSGSLFIYEYTRMKQWKGCAGYAHRYACSLSLTTLLLGLSSSRLSFWRSSFHPMGRRSGGRSLRSLRGSWKVCSSLILTCGSFRFGFLDIVEGKVLWSWRFW